MSARCRKKRKGKIWSWCVVSRNVYFGYKCVTLPYIYIKWSNSFLNPILLILTFVCLNEKCWREMNRYVYETIVKVYKYTIRLAEYTLGYLSSNVETELNKLMNSRLQSKVSAMCQRFIRGMRTRLSIFQDVNVNACLHLAYTIQGENEPSSWKRSSRKENERVERTNGEN